MPTWRVLSRGAMLVLLLAGATALAGYRGALEPLRARQASRADRDRNHVEPFATLEDADTDASSGDHLAVMAVAAAGASVDACHSRLLPSPRYRQRAVPAWSLLAQHTALLS